MGNYFWLVVMPNLHDMCQGLLGITVVVTISLFIFFLVDKNEASTEKEKEERKIFFDIILFSFYLCAGLATINCLMPTKKDIFQLKTLSIIGELKGADQIPQKLIDRINSLLDEDK